MERFPASSSPPLLEVRSVTMRFGGLTAVRDVDLSIAEGGVASIIGPNGAGKTTLFNVLTGVYAPTAGDIRFAGADVRAPLTSATVAAAALCAAATGAGVLAVLFGVPAAGALFDLHTPGRTFPWREGFEAAAAVFRAAHPWPVAAFFAGAAVGAAAFLVLWSRSRYRPWNFARAGICRTFQNIRTFRDMTALDNVLVGLHARAGTRLWRALLGTPAHRRREEELAAEARELLAFVGLAGRGQALAKTLPYGDQRRLEIARALAARPRLLLLDEPAAGMNPSETARLMDLIGAIRARGVTVLLIEHHMSVVMGISDRVTVLDHGEKIAEGPPAAVRADPRVVEAYLGTDAPA